MKSTPFEGTRKPGRDEAMGSIVEATGRLFEVLADSIETLTIDVKHVRASNHDIRNALTVVQADMQTLLLGQRQLALKLTQLLSERDPESLPPEEDAERQGPHGDVER